MSSTVTVLFAICTFAFVVSSSQPSECPDGWVFYPKSGKCFQAVRDTLTHEEAAAECMSRKGVLASINNQAESLTSKEYIESAAPTGTGTFWDGLQCRDGQWEWLDGSKTNFVPHKSCQRTPGYCEAVFVGSGEIRHLGLSCSRRRYGALCQRKAVASAQVVDQLETALACSEERIKELEDRLAATEKVEAYNHGGPPAQFASAQRVEELEKALAHFEERRKTAEAWNKTDDGIFALFAGAFLLLLKLADRLRSQNEDIVPPIPPATNACIDGDEKKQLAEEELSTDSEDEDNDDPSEDEDSEDSSFDQLIDVNME